MEGMQVPKRSNARRRIVRNTAVTCLVTVGYAAFLALLCLEFRHTVPGDTGAYGQTVTLSLVEAAPAAASRPAKARPLPAKPPKPLPAPSDQPPEPTPTEPTPPEETSPEPESNETLELSEADNIALAAFQMPASAGTPGDACNLTGLLAAAFAASPEVRQGLAGLPSAQRSVANAVMLWDGGWPDDTRTGGKALLRALLTKAVSTAPAHCLTQVQRGPVLFFVPDNDMTAVLAVGSGEWRWGDLLTPTAGANYFLTAASEFPTTP